jgi:hypothetical protein
MPDVKLEDSTCDAFLLKQPVELPLLPVDSTNRD